MRAFFLLGAIGLLGCGDDSATPSGDAGRVDSGRSDGGAARDDAGMVIRDAGGSTDAGTDAGGSDAGGSDAGGSDGGGSDGGGSDAGATDAGMPADAGEVSFEESCRAACEAIGVCVGIEPPEECVVGCSADLTACSPSDLAAIDACTTARDCTAGPSGLPRLLECIGAVSCIEM